MLKRVLAIILLFVSILLPATLEAKVQNIAYNTLTPENGLSHISVNALFQDAQHSIWIATRDGLNRFDGSSVKIWRNDKANPNSLISNNVTQIKGDRNGHLYLLCNDGVSQMDIASEQFSVILAGSIDAIDWCEVLYLASGNNIERWSAERGAEQFFSMPDKDVTITNIMMASDGTMWIGTQEKGLFSLDKRGQLREVIPQGRISGIFEDRVGDIWLGTWSDGLYWIETKSGECHNFTSKSDNLFSLSSNFVRDVAEDENGDMWIATSSGPCRLDRRLGQFERYHTEETNSSIWTIIEDAQGSIWFGSYFGGVSYFNPDYNIYSRYNLTASYRSTLEDAVVGKMVEDNRGLLWICTEGGGVFSYNRETETFKHISDYRGNPSISDNIKSVYYDSQRDIFYFGSHLEGLYRYDIGSGRVDHFKYNPSDRWSIPSDVIRDIEPYGNSLILATFNGVALFDPQSGECERLFIDSFEGRKISVASNLLLDQDDRLWIAAEGLGLFTYDFIKRELKNYRNDKSVENSLSSNNVSTIVEDHNGTIWIGHEGAGVDRYNSKSDTFTNFDTHSAGIVGNRIYEICGNRDNTLSISTGEGLSVFDFNLNRSYNYSSQSGYALMSPNENAMCRTADGMIFIGGVDGLISLDVNKLTNVSPREYTIKFSSLYHNQKLIEAGDESGILERSMTHTSHITLPGNTNSFSVSVASSNYIPEIEEPLEFVLEGFDKSWNVVRSGQITYTNLSPGSYTLRARAASQSAYVGEVELGVEILPVWYESGWAWLSYIIIIVLIFNYLNALYRQRVRLYSQVKYEQARIKDIEQQNHKKLQFFTNISHEFRTPLAVIIGQIEMLLNAKQISGAPRTKLISIYKSSCELNSLISELLDFRKHDQGHLRLSIRGADVAEMLRELYDIYREHIVSRGLDFRINCPEGAVMLNCDVAQLRKVVTNLLSNAIKHTANGDYISLVLKELSDEVVIKVEDSGAGIAPHEIDHIFTRFYQGQSSPQSSMGGTGIGLAFSKSIIDLHGGQISVISHLGRGSTFTVEIPLTLEPTLPQTQEPASVAVLPTPAELEFEPTTLLDEEQGGGSVTVLLVEDDTQLLKMLVEIFSAQYNVITAVDGQQGAQMAMQYLPQLIVSDVMMPKVSGIELCRQLKSDTLTCHIPVVLLTARGTAEQAIEGLNCAADDYIVKPFNVNLLLARCNNLVNNRILLQNKYSHQPEENTYKMANNALDQKILERALAIIDKYIDDPRFDIATFSKEIAMSRTNLFNKIKAVTGLTPNDFILTVRLKRAATLLSSHPDMSITEISERVGFSGHRYFSKRFKERFELSPAAYRQRVAQGGDSADGDSR